MAEIWEAPALPARILLWTSAAGSASMLTCLRNEGYQVTFAKDTRPQSALSDFDVVLVDVTALSFDFMQTARSISVSMALRNPHGRLLCVSSISRNPRFVLCLEKCGARYVRIGNSMSLLEAVDLAVSEARLIPASKPRFLIVHRFSTGTCMPGEEISSIHAENDGRIVQLSLALAQRFVFEFLARHRGIAMDSLQIAAGIGGDWFYRDHASNAGVRQAKKIRPGTIKVLVQRIRNAMSKAGVRSDPHQVLRTIPAEGSTRALYEIDAEIRWLHFEKDVQLPIR